MIKFNKDDITDMNLLNKPEARAYIKFLESEKRRHLKDVEDIDKKITEVKKRFNDIPERP